MDETFLYRGEEVRVKEKVRVESSADPSLLVLTAKLGALERSLAERRGALKCVIDAVGRTIGDDTDEDT